MFIEDPSFIHRKIMNARNDVNSDDSSFKFGTQRNQLIKYVTSALAKHEKDELILEKFRKQAEQLKKRKFQSKKKSIYENVLSKKSTNQNLPPITISNPSLVNQQQKEVMSPKIMQDMSSRHEKELESVLHHQSGLVEKYRKLLNIKEKQLKSKDKKLERNKHALEKMSQRVKYLQKERFLVQKEQELQMNHMNNILKQLTNQIAQNKSNLSFQLNNIRKEAKLNWEANLSTELKTNENNQVENHEQVMMKKPVKNQLELIKRKAKSLKHDSEAKFLRSPTVLYTKIPTEQSHQVDSPRNGNYLSELNRSIIKRSKFIGLISQENNAAK